MQARRTATIKQTALIIHPDGGSASPFHQWLQKWRRTIETKATEANSIGPHIPHGLKSLVLKVPEPIMEQANSYFEDALHSAKMGGTNVKLADVGGTYKNMMPLNANRERYNVERVHAGGKQTCFFGWLTTFILIALNKHRWDRDQTPVVLVNGQQAKLYEGAKFETLDEMYKTVIKSSTFDTRKVVGHKRPAVKEEDDAENRPKKKPRRGRE